MNTRARGWLGAAVVLTLSLSAALAGCGSGAGETGNTPGSTDAVATASAPSPTQADGVLPSSAPASGSPAEASDTEAPIDPTADRGGSRIVYDFAVTENDDLEAQLAQSWGVDVSQWMVDYYTSLGYNNVRYNGASSSYEGEFGKYLSYDSYLAEVDMRCVGKDGQLSPDPRTMLVTIVRFRELKNQATDEWRIIDPIVHHVTSEDYAELMEYASDHYQNWILETITDDAGLYPHVVVRPSAAAVAEHPELVSQRCGKA